MDMIEAEAKKVYEAHLATQLREREAKAFYFHHLENKEMSFPLTNFLIL